MIPVYKPYLPAYITRYAHEAIDSGWISSRGVFVDKTINKLKDLLNIKHVLLVNNGTSATHLLSKVIQYKYPSINTIVAPNNVYVAAWNSFLYDNLYKLEILDTDLDTWNFDKDNLKKFNFSDKALLVVHNIGNIVNVPELREKYNISVIVEDNCEGFLGKYNNKYSGTESLASSISFFGNKNITSGEGGAFLTNDEAVYDYVKCLHGQGMSDTKFIHNKLGYNYRITNIQAALLYGQLEHLNEILERKQKVFELYRKYLDGIDGISFQKIEENTIHSNWMFSIRVHGNKSYNKLQSYMNKSRIEVRPLFYPVDYHSHLVSRVNFQISNNPYILNREVVILPSHPELEEDDIKYICNRIYNYIRG